jgi:hypothetical protein
MDQTIKIQEEFEKLIDQLERLKKINELTSLNTETAKEVINHIGGFIKSANDFKLIFEEDFKNKSQAIEKLLVSSESSISKVEKIANESSSILTNSLDNFKHVTNNSLEEFSLKQKLLLNGFIKIYESENSELTARIKKISEELSGNQLTISKNFRVLKIMILVSYLLFILLAIGIMFLF